MYTLHVIVMWLGSPSSQINKIDNRGLCHSLSSIIFALLYKCNSNNGMGSRGGSIHVGWSDGPVLCSLSNPSFNVLIVFDGHWAKLVNCKREDNVIQWTMITKMILYIYFCLLYVIEYEKRDHFAVKLIMQYKQLKISKHYLLYINLIFQLA